jgi:hypothetical protein
MGRVNWNRVADREFKSMPEDFQSAWGDLYEEVSKNQ